MKKYIFGNFKMNMTLKETESFIEEFLPKVENSKNCIAIFPSFVNLMFAKQKLTASNVKLGAQNVSSEAGGCYTGEVSAKMLSSVGADYVLVGHGERRQNFYEKNELINKKIKQALSEGLKVVLCVGETKYERQTKKYKLSLERDLSECLKGLYENELKNIIIAYEPLWAIDTGKLPSGKEIEEAVWILRNRIKLEYSEKSSKTIKVIYGGSVNDGNVKNIVNVYGVDGALVGSASLSATEFANICKV